ncbi:hypothetical protein F4810DRAFT_647540 [Camillea tinctor]|nr:hypothetical protein F4810DRAFT_647540 [Camillea tinctor]
MERCLRVIKRGGLYAVLYVLTQLRTGMFSIPYSMYNPHCSQIDVLVRTRAYLDSLSVYEIYSIDPLQGFLVVFSLYLQGYILVQKNISLLQ